MTLAIFDLDETLLDGDSENAWNHYLIEVGAVDKDEFAEKNEAFFNDYKAGCLDINAYLEFALRPLKNNSMQQLLTWREDFLQVKIKPMMMKGARELINEHRAQGNYLLIITATNRFVTEEIARDMGVDALIATELEMINGEFTGKVEGVPSFREGKVVRLKEWLGSQKETLDGAFFYSDSINDLPLLELVDNPIATNPDDQLNAIALARKWPVLHLRCSP